MGPGFNRDGLVDDVALDARGGRQAHLEATHCANDATVYNNIIRHTFAVHSGAFANGQQMRADVAVHGALDQDIARCFQVACDVQVC